MPSGQPSASYAPALAIRAYNRGALQGRVQRRFATPVNAYRSGLEAAIAGELKDNGVSFDFEKFKLPYSVPQRDAKYTPDFVLRNGIIIETKGLFQTDDRKKMRLIKEQYPDLDIRFIFSNANAKIAKKSPTSYAKWATDQGFKWAHRHLPIEWTTEPTNLKALKAAKDALKPGK